MSTEDLRCVQQMTCPTDPTQTLSAQDIDTFGADNEKHSMTKAVFCQTNASSLTGITFVCYVCVDKQVEADLRNRRCAKIRKNWKIAKLENPNTITFS